MKIEKVAILDAGRHTEIDMFSGALMRMGQMIKALEEKNDGKFDYTGKETATCAK